MGFILERNLLQPGDIILTGIKSLVSLGVRTFTISRYSHAAIYVGGTMIEATLAGVFSKNVQRLIGERKSDIAVYRSKRKLSEKEIKMICSYARSKVGSLYALDEAITMRLKSTLKLDKTKRQFCSRLVAESYAHIGYDFINLRNPSYCSPRQLSLCKAFYKVDDILRRATPKDIELSQTDDPNEENLRRTFEWLNKVRNMIQADDNHKKNIDIQTISDVDDFLMSHPEYDSIVAGFMKDSGYLDHYNEDTKRNQYRYNEQWFSIVMKNESDIQEFLDFELDKEPEMFDRFMQMLNRYMKLLRRKNLECYRLHLRLYINLLTGVYVRLMVIGSGAKDTIYHKSSTEIKKLSNLVKHELVSAEVFINGLGT